MLKVQDLSVCYDKKYTILDDINFSLDARQWLMVVGPNGAGKSTLVNAIAQGVPHTGTVFFEKTDLGNLRPADLARKLGVLMQNHNVSYSFTVEEVVRLGRYSYGTGFFGTRSDEDNHMVEQALADTGLLAFRDQSVLTLSGGELQRTFLAQLLAQNPKLLILDEPANHLDLVYQKQVFDLISHWMQEKDRAVISVVHDLSLAKSYGTHALLLNAGHVVDQGEIDSVLSEENLHRVYKMDVYAWMRSMLAQWSA